MGLDLIVKGESKILKLLRQSGGVPVHRFILFLLDVLDRTCLVGEAFLCPCLHLGTELQPRLVTVLVRYCRGVQVLQDDLQISVRSFNSNHIVKIPPGGTIDLAVLLQLPQKLHRVFIRVWEFTDDSVQLRGCESHVPSRFTGEGLALQGSFYRDSSHV
ncbi:hypothetical protein GDO81_024745 [Engystomops pustulosus]|uniref:Uncharacterized protein n=1 Tax=Engystomops pustulosus TaxID=76066 RepID=A0AAV6YIK3_ENGPU|nr:hypothetical protein GDO81_024745 [Engystomops pustulosus]